MSKHFLTVLVSVIIIVACSSVSICEENKELLLFQSRLETALKSTVKWQSVSVPSGRYTVGKEIPEGGWLISSDHPDNKVTVKTYKLVAGKDWLIEKSDVYNNAVYYLPLHKGLFVEIDGGEVVFQTYYPQSFFFFYEEAESFHYDYPEDLTANLDILKGLQSDVYKAAFQANPIAVYIPVGTYYADEDIPSGYWWFYLPPSSLPCFYSAEVSIGPTWNDLERPYRDVFYAIWNMDFADFSSYDSKLYVHEIKKGDRITINENAVIIFPYHSPLGVQ